MAKLREIADEIIRAKEGGISVDESKYDLQYIYSLIHQARAQAIFTFWQKTKRVNNSWTQKFIATYAKDLQDNNCCVKFEAPSAISLDNKMDGFLYIGTVDWNCAYRKVESRSKNASFNKYRYTRNNTNIPRVLYSDGFLEVWGNTFIRELQVDGIFNNPTSVPTFSVDYDEYPCDSALLEQIKVILLNQDLKPQVGPIDVKSDSQSTINAAQGGVK
jgi:hypothetical protein